MAALAAEAKAATVPATPTGALTPGEIAAEQVLAPVDEGEGPQVGVLGDPGTGKTVALGELVKLYLRKSPGFVLVVDDKERRARFEGQERRNVAELVARPLDPNGSRVIVFRGDPVAGEDANPEEVAKLAWRRVARGRHSLIVHDELIAGREEYLVKNQQWRKGVSFVPRSFTKGRAVGIGDIWGAQFPQQVPLEPFNCSNAILCFRCGGAALAKLDERGYLEGGAREVIPRLHGPPDPQETRGDFLLLRPGLPWDGNIYKFKVGG